MKTFISALLASVLIWFGSSAHAQLLPIPETEQSTIGYKTVDEALKALRGNPDVDVRVQGGWTIAEEHAAKTIWSFVPQEHPAYPAVVKRNIYEKDGKVLVGMNVLCQAGKAACDNLFMEFQQLNARMSESLQQKAQQGAPADVPASRAHR